MSLLFAVASQLQFDNQATLDYIEEIVTPGAQNLFNVLPFVNISPAFVNQYARQVSIGTAEWLTEEGTSTPTNVSGSIVQDQIKVLHASANIARRFQSSASAVLGQVRGKLQSVTDGFGTYFITGDGTSGAITGLSNLITSGQTVSVTSGSVLSRTHLRQMVSKVVVGGEQKVILANSRGIDTIKAILDNYGGTSAAMAMLPNFSAPVLTWEGIPILRLDSIPTNVTYSNVTNTESIYCAALGDPSGLYGFFNAANLFEQRIIPVANSDHDNFNFNLRVGLSCGSTLALSRIQGVPA